MQATQELAIYGMHSTAYMHKNGENSLFDENIAIIVLNF